MLFATDKILGHWPFLVGSYTGEVNPLRARKEMRNFAEKKQTLMTVKGNGKLRTMRCIIIQSNH